MTVSLPVPTLGPRAFGAPVPDRPATLWPEPTAHHVEAVTAVTAATTGTTGSPDVTAVDPVVAHLRAGGLWDPADAAPSFDSPGHFADWLDADPRHQARAGVVGVYTGSAGMPTDPSAAVRSGDVVVSAACTDTGGTRVPVPVAEAIGVVGPDGRLYNRGLVAQDGLRSVRVYRPIRTTERP